MRRTQHDVVAYTDYDLVHVYQAASSSECRLNLVDMVTWSELDVLDDLQTDRCSTQL